MAQHTLSTEELADLHEITVEELPANIPGSKFLAGDIDTAQLKDDAVTTAKFLNGAVVADKILANNVTTLKIVDGAVTADKIVANAVTTAKILNDNVTTPKLGTGAVTTPKILNDNVTTAKLSPDTLQTATVDIAAGAMLTLNSIPVELVAAIPGSILEFVSAMIILDWNGVAYANNGDIGVYETDSNGNLVGQITELATFGALVADAIMLLRPAQEATPSVVAQEYTAGVPLVLSQGVGDSINGDSPVRVKITYRVHVSGL